MFCACGGVLHLKKEVRDYLPVEYLVCDKCKRVIYDPGKIKEFKILMHKTPESDKKSTSSNFKIVFKPDNKIFEVDAQVSVLDAAKSHGIDISGPCGGLGSCEKCKIRVDKGDYINKSRVFENGFVLACQIYPKSDLEIFIPDTSRNEKDHQILMDKCAVKEVNGDVGFAVDIGTTTVVAYLIDLSNGSIADTEGDYNKQIAYGGDVIARMDYARKNRLEMQNLVVETINGLVKRILDRNNLSKDRIKKFVFSGNEVMIYLLLGRDTEEIRNNPVSDNYKKAYSGSALDLNIIGSGDYYTVPGIGAYVGGDIVSDIVFSGMTLFDEYSMLIDIGTNGQIAIGNKDFILACSTSAGPALEGGGIEWGMRASSGAIDKFDISDDFEVKYRVIGNVQPKGICGSGLISLVSELFGKKIIDHRGKINRNLNSKTNRVNEDKFFLVWKEETENKKDIFITEKDIENFIYAKAAIYTGSYVLTQKSGISFDDISKIYVAGGFGNFIDFSKAEKIGLFPGVDKNKFIFIGNGSVRGAHLILTSEDKKNEANRISKISTYFDLASDSLFMEEYVKAVYLPHLDLDRFKEE